MKLRSFLLISILFIILLFSNKNVFATHCAGYDLKYEWKGGLDYEVTLYFYRDCIGAPAPPNAPICFTSIGFNLSGTVTIYPIDTNIITPVCTTVQTYCTNGTFSGIEQHIYQGMITLPKACSDWLFSWGYCCRNVAITTGPASQNFYAEAFLNNVVAPDNSSPYFTNLPVAWLCHNQNFTYNHGALDPNGDSLVYTLATPMTNTGCNYLGLVTYNAPYTYLQPLTTLTGMTFNPVTGDINLQPTNITEVTVMLVKVEEFRNNVLVGRVYRDMQLYVIPCNNIIPVLSGIDSTNIYSTSTCVNKPINFDIFSFDPDSGQALTLAWNNGISGGTFNSAGTPHPVGTFSWTPTMNDLGFNSFTVIVEDDNCPYTGLQVFSYTIWVNALNVDLGPDQYLNCVSTTPLQPTVTGATGPLTYLWNTGDTTASVTATKPGIYIVEVWDTTGCWGTDSIELSKGISADFTTSNTCINDSASFFDATFVDNGFTVGWYWNFGNSFTSTLKNPKSVFSTAGTYTVTLISTDNFGCKDTISKPVTIYPLPIPDFTVNLACLGGVTTFNDISAPAGSIVSWNWDFGNFDSSNLKNPSTSYNLADNFSVILTVTDSNGCSNSITHLIKVNPKPIADFTTADVCIGETSVFVDKSNAPPGGLVTWIWDFGDGASSNLTNPMHLYGDSGTFVITLIVSDSMGCWDTLQKTVSIHPLPDVSFTGDPLEGCRTLEVQFENNSDPLQSSTFAWNLGNGGVSSLESPKWYYQTAGVYSVGLTTTTKYGCDSTFTFPDMIKVYELPVAEFDHKPGRPTIFNNTIQFYDESIYPEEWYWDFGTGLGDFSSIQNPVFTFQDTLTYTIELLVKKFWHSGTAEGCYDTISHKLTIEPEFTYHLPNAFTPNDDGINDVFKGIGYYTGITGFNMQIWTRWGHLIFETNDIEEGWNGRLFNRGKEAQDGVYVYVVILTNDSYETRNYKGIVVLLK
ncbi:MAG: PKD domain-containing protein [Bacteroidetes bacterium]|nr:PKD domain-containing protein [Bacteroidota bacterium]